MMLVTINTDASFIHQYKIGGYAFWAVSNEFRVTKYGLLKDECLDPHDAEMKCIINALHCVFLERKSITKIIVNTDSMNAIHLFTNNQAKIKKYKLDEKYRHLKLMFFLKFVSKGIEIEFRHVKAHTGKNDARSYVNEWCDKHAKQSAKDKVAEILKSQLSKL